MQRNRGVTANIPRFLSAVYTLGDSLDSCTADLGGVRPALVSGGMNILRRSSSGVSQKFVE